LPLTVVIVISQHRPLLKALPLTDRTMGRQEYCKEQILGVLATLYPKSFADFATTAPTYLQPWTVTA
jgi:hypothetical protein